jgi:hypothetical protein
MRRSLEDGQVQWSIWANLDSEAYTMTGNPSVTRVFKRVDARDVLLHIRANPGVSRHDLNRDFGFRAPIIAGGLVKLGLVKFQRGARGQTYWPVT